MDGREPHTENRLKSPPAARVDLVDLEFIRNRARLIEIAAFLDRIERVGQNDDFRMEAFKRALNHLAEPGSFRARRILEEFSDPTTEPIAKAHTKGASGAYEPA